MLGHTDVSRRDDDVGLLVCLVDIKLSHGNSVNRQRKYLMSFFKLQIWMLTMKGMVFN